MNYFRMCLNPKVIALLIVLGVGVVIVAPSFATRAIPLLVVAACPLSMLLMGGMMMKGQRGAGQQDKASSDHDAISRRDR
jgi:predicted permease